MNKRLSTRAQRPISLFHQPHNGPTRNLHCLSGPEHSRKRSSRCRLSLFPPGDKKHARSPRFSVPSCALRLHLTKQQQQHTHHTHIHTILFQTTKKHPQTTHSLSLPKKSPQPQQWKISKTPSPSPCNRSKPTPPTQSTPAQTQNPSSAPGPSSTTGP